MSGRSLGAIIAGGRSSRYGSPKALAEVAGQPIIRRVARALECADTHVVALTAEAAIAAVVGVPARPDVLPDLGALGGIHAALLWAREEKRPGALAVACDMPFLSVPLLRRILELAAIGSFDLVAPEGGGPRAVEPLCAWYAVDCLPAIERASERGDRRLIGFHADVRVRRIALTDVESYGPPARLFMNVNSSADRERAERIAREVDS